MISSTGGSLFQDRPQKKHQPWRLSPAWGKENLGYTSIWIHLTISFKYEDLSHIWDFECGQVPLTWTSLRWSQQSHDQLGYIIYISHVQLIPAESEKPWYYTYNEQLADWLWNPWISSPKHQATRVFLDVWLRFAHVFPWSPLKRTWHFLWRLRSTWTCLMATRRILGTFRVFFWIL